MIYLAGAAVILGLLALIGYWMTLSHHHHEREAVRKHAIDQIEAEAASKMLTADTDLRMAQIRKQQSELERIEAAKPRYGSSDQAFAKHNMLLESYARTYMDYDMLRFAGEIKAGVIEPGDMPQWG